MGGDSTEGHTYLWHRSSGRWRRHGGSRGRGRWHWHGGPSDTCRNTRGYDGVVDTVELVLPVGSGAASSAFAAVKKQEGAPSREIGYTTPPPPQSHPPPPFPIALWLKNNGPCCVKGNRPLPSGPSVRKRYRKKQQCAHIVPSPGTAVFLS